MQQSYAKSSPVKRRGIEKVGDEIQQCDAADLKVRYFDESVGLDDNVRQMLNERILEVESQARKMIQQNQANYQDMAIRLAKFEKLPADRAFLAAMPIEEIFQCAAILVTDAQELWELIEECWRPNFFEKICLKIYGPMFNENADPRFSETLKQMEDKCQEQLTEIQANYQRMLEESREQVRRLKSKMLENDHDYAIMLEDFQAKAQW